MKRDASLPRASNAPTGETVAWRVPNATPPGGHTVFQQRPVFWYEHNPAIVEELVVKRACEAPTDERKAFEAWWPTVGQTIGEIAAWLAWERRAAQEPKRAMESSDAPATMTQDERAAVQFYACNPSAALFDLGERLKRKPDAPATAAHAGRRT